MIRELRRQIDTSVPPDEKGFRSMPMSAIADAIGYTPNKGQLWDDLAALKNETIAYNVLEKDGGTLKKGSGFILEWGVTNHRIDFKLPSFIEDLITGLDEPKAIFQSLNWDIFNQFTGKYQAVIYKLCRDYLGVGRTPLMDIERFREYMGIAPHEYKEFRDLNKYVISGPIKDINALDVSDIKVQVEFQKKGRKVTGLQFTVETKNQLLLPMAELSNHISFRFAKVPIDPKTQQKYLSLRPPEEIEKCIVRANEYGDQQSKSGKETNYGALYRKAINEGWHSTIVAREEVAESKAKRKTANENVLKAKEEEELLRNAAAKEKIDDAFKIFGELSEGLKDQYREDFRATLKAVPLRKSFDKQGEEAPIIRSQFAEYFMSVYKPKKSRTK